MNKTKALLVVALVVAITCVPFFTVGAQGYDQVRFLRVLVNLIVDGDVTVGDDLTVTDDSTLTDDVNIGGDLAVDGTSDLDDVTVTGTFAVAGKLGTATMAVEVEYGDKVTVTIQLKDNVGAELATSAGCMWYLSQDSAGAAVADGAPSGGIAILTDGLLIPWTANMSGWAVGEADGDIAVVVEDNGDDTFYLVLVMPDGSLVISAVLTFAA